MFSSSSKVQRNEARKLEDVPRRELEIRKKDGYEYKPESAPNPPTFFLTK